MNVEFARMLNLLLKRSLSVLGSIPMARAKAKSRSGPSGTSGAVLVRRSLNKAASEIRKRKAAEKALQKARAEVLSLQRQLQQQQQQPQQQQPSNLAAALELVWAEAGS